MGSPRRSERKKKKTAMGNRQERGLQARGITGKDTEKKFSSWMTLESRRGHKYPPRRGKQKRIAREELVQTTGRKNHFTNKG